MNKLGRDSCLDLKEEYGTDDIKEILKIIENEPSLRMTEEEEKREYAIMMQRRRDYAKEIETRVKPKDKFLNYLQKRVLISEITKEMEEKEEQWGIDYADYLHDLT